jgi:hypothetical protein
MSVEEFNGRYSVMTQKEYVGTLFAELPGGAESQALLEKKYDHLERIEELQGGIDDYLPSLRSKAHDGEGYESVFVWDNNNGVDRDQCVKIAA